MLIEIVHAGRERTVCRSLRLEAPATVADALAAAAAEPEFNGIDLTGAAVGIFGMVVGREQLLANGDRIEIYRELAADPKVARRQRAKAARNP